MKPLVSIIILTYNRGLPHVRKCLLSLRKLDYKECETILVDNASKDETVRVISKEFPNVRIIKNSKNFGFCKANNDAVKKTHGKYILFLNNDTEVSPDFLTVLVRVLEEDSSIGVAQPKICQLIKKEKLDACSSFLTHTGFLYHYGYSQDSSDKKYNKQLDMYSVKGACFLARADLIKKIGLFDEDFFAYFEETDFCHRVWMSGLRVSYEPSAKIYHLGGATGSDHPERIQYDAYKNRIQSYLKNLELRFLLAILPSHILLCIFLSIVYLTLGKIKMSTYILKAIWWNLINIHETLGKRKRVQNEIRKISEKEYIEKILLNPKLSYYFHFMNNPRGKYIEDIPLLNVGVSDFKKKAH